MANWTFLTSRAWALLCIAHDPEVRPRDIAARRGFTECGAYGTVTDLAEAGYVVRQKNGRRSRCQTGHTCRCRNPAANSAPSATFWPFLAGTAARP